MSDKYDDGGYAFPWGEHGTRLGGMSLRDYFEAKAMQAILIARLINNNGTIGVNNFEYQVAEDAEAMADAMLNQRKANER